MTRAMTQENPIPGWQSKAKWTGKAHFVLADGSTACAERGGPYGIRMRDLFKTEWKPLDSNDHLCGMCQRDYPRECECGRCRIRRSAAAAPKSFEAIGARRTLTTWPRHEWRVVTSIPMWTEACTRCGRRRINMGRDYVFETAAGKPDGDRAGPCPRGAPSEGQPNEGGSPT